MELLLSREKDHLEKNKQKLFAERMQLAETRLKLQQVQEMQKEGSGVLSGSETTGTPTIAPLPAHTADS